ncbi:uncharacterized protein LOC141910108 [Tubulanus polymorphus]|uniref:uncharacterized protein LOC141910108 n=1 Tax=Tubulanus polymorphus TaxID=672921 RepID=UPI003DA65C67
MEFSVTDDSAAASEADGAKTARSRGISAMVDEQRELNGKLGKLRLDCQGKLHRIDREKNKILSEHKRDKNNGSSDSLASRGSADSAVELTGLPKAALRRRGSVDVGLLMNERRAQQEFSNLAGRRGSDSKLDRHHSHQQLRLETRRESLPPTLVPPPMYKLGRKQSRQIEPPKHVNSGPKTRAQKPPNRKPKSYKELSNDPEHVNYLLHRASQY